jgi:hypothetical protein
MTAEEYKDLSGAQIQSSWYWISSVVATIVFLVVLFFLLMVPGVTASEKLLTLSVAGLLLASSLAIGLWGFRTRDVPVMRWPAGPPVGVFVALELAYCLAGLIALIAKTKF